MRRLFMAVYRIMPAIIITAAILSGNVTDAAAAGDKGGSENSGTLTVIVMIAAFLAATAVSAFITYRIRRKNSVQEAAKSDDTENNDRKGS